ncbi:CHAT domain-containing protein [Mycena sanguinolenta]|nr:CHAT domain-containing protein [Mycena sanguinolenta]
MKIVLCDQMIQEFENTYPSIPPDNLLRHLYLTLLGNAYLIHLDLFPETSQSDLDNAIKCLEMVDEAKVINTGGIIPYYTGFGAVLWHRSRSHTRHVTDLDRSISYYRQALRINRDPNTINCLVRSMNEEFEISDDMAILEEQINLSTEAAEMEATDTIHSASLNNLGSALGQKYGMTGHYPTLCASIDYLLQALAIRRRCNNPLIPSTLNQLANGFMYRFWRTVVKDDAMQGLAYYREALKLRKHDLTRRASTANNLSTALYNLYVYSGERELIDEALELQKMEYESMSPNHPLRLSTISNLASLYLALASRFPAERSSLLPYAEDFSVQALDLSRSHSSSSYAAALHDRGWLNLISFVHTRDTAYLTLATRTTEEALEVLPPNSPRTTKFQTSLARVHMIAYAHWHKFNSKQPQAVHAAQEAMRLYSTVANDERTLLRPRIQAAKEWASLPEQVGLDWPRVPHEWHRCSVEAFRLLFQLVNRFAIKIPDVTNQHERLASLPDSIVSDAAASAVQAGMPAAAVELLEYGQDLIMANLRGFRGRYSIEALREAAPTLADRFVEISEQLEHQSIKFKTRIDLPTDRAASEEEIRLGRMVFIDKHAQLQEALLDQYKDVVEQIRGIPGGNWENFLKPAPFDTLRKADEEGPVIIPIISKYRSDVLIIHGGQGDPHVISLGGTNIAQYIGAFSNRFKKIGDTLQSREFSPREAQQATKSLVLDLQAPGGICALVFAKLAELRVPKKSRIWWMLPGKSTFLPFHASSRKYVSSYTTSLSALLDSRRRALPASSQPTLLAVGVSQYSSARDLPIVEKELDTIEQMAKTGVMSATILRGKDAHKANIMRKMEHHSSVHLSCHGTLSENDPFESALCLSGDDPEDSLLTLRELMSSVGDLNADTAFMSACHTANRDTVNAPDERVNLATAFQLCGFRSVIGSLFVMGDADGYILAKEFYDQKFNHKKDSATALHLAVDKMRKDKSLDLKDWSRWIGFIHLGA